MVPVADDTAAKSAWAFCKIRMLHTFAATIIPAAIAHTMTVALRKERIRDELLVVMALPFPGLHRTLLVLVGHRN